MVEFQRPMGNRTFSHCLVKPEGQINRKDVLSSNQIGRFQIATGGMRQVAEDRMIAAYPEIAEVRQNEIHS